MSAVKEPTLPFPDPPDREPAPATPAAAREAPLPLPGSRERPWCVADLNDAARALLEKNYGDVWLQGEVSNFKPHSSGHWYFSIKDDRAQISAVMFRAANAQVRFRAEDGLAVLARGRITLYPARGSYQINIQSMEPLGLGALQMAFEQLKRRLQAEGLFSEDRKRPIPAMPHRVAVVTSPTGAALRDILRVLERRAAGLPVLIVPCLVQGDLAAAQIADAIRRINTHARASVAGGTPDDIIDVIIIARGGGSLEDLWPFNEEVVARAIAASDIPIIAAVGHETDVTIADFVADLRAPTPSAAAEMVVRSREDLTRQVRSAATRLLQATRLLLLRLGNQVQALAASRAFARVEGILSDARQRHDEALTRIIQSVEDRVRGYRDRLRLAAERLSPRSLRAEIASRRSRLEAAAEGLDRAMRARLKDLRECVASRQALLGSLSPVAVLDRGYAICQDDRSGSVITSSEEVSDGQGIRVRLSRGELGARVTSVEPGTPGESRKGRGTRS